MSEGVIQVPGTERPGLTWPGAVTPNQGLPFLNR